MPLWTRLRDWLWPRPPADAPPATAARPRVFAPHERRHLDQWLHELTEREERLRREAAAEQRARQYRDP